MSSQRHQQEKENTRYDHCAAVRKEDFLHAVFATTFTRELFSASSQLSDFGVVAGCQNDVIFFLTSLFNDSRFQSVAANDRCESMNNGKGE
jgi:hypothetical protein